MRDDCSVSDTGPFARKPRVITTSGEILPDGTIVELVAAGHNLLLCHWDGKQHFVLPCLDVGNIVYTPPRLEPSLYSAFRFPGPPMEYGSLETLFDATAAVFEARGFSTDVGHSCALFALASWLPEFFFDPPTLVVYGSEMMQAAVLFSLLGCLCRRSFLPRNSPGRCPFGCSRPCWCLRPKRLSKSVHSGVRRMSAAFGCLRPVVRLVVWLARGRSSSMMSKHSHRGARTFYVCRCSPACSPHLQLSRS
jgi:hypothetical protein